jgi:hypothetical protein
MQELAPQKRSDFVTVLAWIFIVLTGFATFISLLQNIMVSFFFPLEKIQQTILTPEAQQQIPPIFLFLFMHIRLLFLGFLAVSAMTLAAAIGLLRRKNWARLVFIGLMALGILWNLVGIVIQQLMFNHFPQVPPTSDPEFAQNFSRMMTIMKYATAVLAFGLTALFGWIIKKLISPIIRAEFLNGHLE